MANSDMVWFVPNQVIYALSSARNLDESRQMVDLAIEMMEHSKAPHIHHLIDQLDMADTIIDSNIDDLDQILRRMLQHPKMGWVLTFYGNNLFVQHANWLFGHRSNAKTKHFITPRAAVEFLTSVDETLPLMPDISEFIKTFKESRAM
jgi:hypothetical protein